MVAVSNINKWFGLLALGWLSFGKAEPVELQGVTFDQWSKTLEKYPPKIVVVDFWATWCSSCLERFPHMVKMSTEFEDQSVQFVSMLLEDPKEAEAMAEAKAFLNKQFQAKPTGHFDHYFMNENLMLAFERLDLLGIPAVFIYDENGALAHRLTGDNPNNQFTESDIHNNLLKMLKTRP